MQVKLLAGLLAGHAILLSLALVVYATPVYYSGTAHYYDYVEVGGSLDWQGCKTDAAGKSYNGMPGHLVTITSAEEQAFVKTSFDYLSRLVWLGGYQPVGSSEPSGGWRWVTPEPWGYTNWGAGEPNNWLNNENNVCMDLINTTTQHRGKWHDGAPSYASGYFVEYEAPAPPQPPAPVIPGPITPIPPNPEKRNVVIVTHGINDRADGGWPQVAGMSISAQSDSTWACDWYDWRDNAESPVPPLIGNMALARYEGQRLGEALLSGDRSWDHVHLIGHSLGAFVISSAARYIEEHKPGTNMHLTFLDPYILNHVTLMNDLDFVQSKAGQYWSDNYFVKDLTGAFTEGSSQYCHNVDLSNIMPNILWPFDYQHNWVHDWYQETIDAWPGPGMPEYGYARSLEASLVSWNANLRGDYPLGNMSPVKPEKTKQGAWAWLASIVSPSITGTVTVDENGLGLGTGSPVWASMLLVLEEADNYIQFQYQFNGIGEGFLSVYLNDQLILLGDERLDDGELCDSGSIYIRELLEDVNWLSFRLDPLDDDPAGIWISDIEYGHVTPEPATAALLALGALGMLLRHRRKA